VIIVPPSEMAAVVARLSRAEAVSSGKTPLDVVD
jgi:hypothetical protein